MSSRPRTRLRGTEKAIKNPCAVRAHRKTKKSFAEAQKSDVIAKPMILKLNNHRAPNLADSQGVRGRAKAAPSMYRLMVARTVSAETPNFA